MLINKVKKVYVIKNGKERYFDKYDDFLVVKTDTTKLVYNLSKGSTFNNDVCISKRFTKIINLYKYKIFDRQQIINFGEIESIKFYKDVFIYNDELKGPMRSTDFIELKDTENNCIYIDILYKHVFLRDKAFELGNPMEIHDLFIKNEECKFDFKNLKNNRLKL